jgi:UDP-N-acetylmuramoylalanine--D-glutamate ligase
MRALVEKLGEVKEVVALSGTGTDRVKSELPEGTIIYSSIADAVAAARSAAEAGDTILFSPAFASFGMFKNEYDRNDQFVALVNAL